MKVIDLLNVIDEASSVEVWKDNELLSVYDGKDSIDSKLNNEVVKSISSGYFKIAVEI